MKGKVYLHEPYKPLPKSVVIVDSEDTLIKDNPLYRNSYVYRLEPDSIVNGKLFTRFPDCDNLIMKCTGARLERNMAIILRGLWEYDAMRFDLYLANDSMVKDVFCDIAERGLPKPEDASAEIEEDGKSLLDIAEELEESLGSYDIPDEPHQHIAPRISVDVKGDIYQGNRFIGNVLCISNIVYGKPLENLKFPVWCIMQDSDYTPGTPTLSSKQPITLRGTLVDTCSSIWQDMSRLRTGLYAMCKNIYDKTWNIMYSRQMLVYFDNPNKSHPYWTAVDYDKLDEYMSRGIRSSRIDTALGLLYARCVCRDRRRTFNFECGLYYDGQYVAMDFDDKTESLSLDNFYVRSSNFQSILEDPRDLRRRTL